ncbi:MAG TPA: cytochrome c biogenesis protein CcsA [Blastocatellia bacterium]|nr:cytochrome c biogenesis protein CcsA [Blastocatellia bacterium]
MSQAVKSFDVSLDAAELRRPALLNYLPALLPLIGVALMIAARINSGPTKFFDDGGLIVLAVLCYIFAAAFHLTNLYAPINALQKAGVWVMSLGFFFNLSSWTMRWITSGERENWVRMVDKDGVHHALWFFSYIPFQHLYDLSLAFAFGAAFTTLLIEHRKGSRFVGAISMSLVTLVLLQAIFIGNDVINLPPVLDSYWRPIHVGVASMSYGIALVSFAIAVMFLLKDGVKPEAMGIFTTLATVVGYIFFSNSFGPLSATYRMNPVIIDGGGVAFVRGARVPVPGVGLWLTISLLLLIATAACFLLYHFREDQQARRFGHYALRASLVTQGLGIATLFYQIKNLKNLGAIVGPDQYYSVGRWIANNSSGMDASKMQVQELVQQGAQFLSERGSLLALDTRAHPVEVSGIVAAFVVTLFIILFSFRTERLRESLPSLEKLDSLIYRTVGVAVAGLAILLVTGAVWANESWGRYWGWDPKETGALVAWLSYLGYLHTRISHGWAGRRSAYFAVVGFLLVIFTYLGVSYLLPGLHSYAGRLD